MGYMRVSLTVAVPGDMEGKQIPVTIAEFLIGRDPACHLCPGSPRVGKRHCALLVRHNKVFLKNFDHATGTYVNDRRIDGEVQLMHGDLLKIGPLLFQLNIEAANIIADGDHEDLAAQVFLIEGQENMANNGGDAAKDGQQGSESAQPAEDAKQTPKPEPSAATKAILAKYRRPR